MDAQRTFLTALLAVFWLSIGVDSQPSFSYDTSATLPGLQVDSTGTTFVSAGNMLYRLSPSLTEEESVSLSANVVSRGLSLSNDGTTLAVCLVDLSCSLYSANNLTAGPLITANNAIVSADFGVAVISAGTSFYTGSVTGENRNDRMVLQQYGEGFTRSSEDNDVAHNGPYNYNQAVSRDFYGGFERDGFTYYIVFDYNPVDFRAFRLLRVCNNVSVCGGASTCGVDALYEAGFGCGQSSISNNARLCGFSILEDFGGLTGTIGVLSRCEPSTSRSAVCLINITAVSEAMDSKFDSCTGNGPADEQIDTIWETANFCSNVFNTGSPTLCDIAVTLGLTTSSMTRVTGPNLITASVAVKVEEFSFVFVGTVTESNGATMILGYDVAGAFTSTPFITLPAPSRVEQLAWQEGQNYITAATSNSVYQVPIEECSSNTDCTNCIADPNPLCGWCVVENKCSRRSQCQNSSLPTRWTQNSTHCIMASVEPSQLVLDSANETQNLTVTLNSPGLPAPLPGESFSCHLADSEDRFPAIVVPALEISPGTVYSCDIEGRVPSYEGVTAVINLGFQSSLFDITFDITNGALTTYRCSEGSSCSECLQTDSPCGWCNLNKMCSGSSMACRNASFFLQLSGVNTYTDLCPLLDDPPSGEYIQPVRLDQDIQLATRNLLQPTDGFQYSCVINGVQLTAEYQNETSILCQVNSNDLVLPANTGSSAVPVMVIWSHSQDDITHPVGSINSQTNVTLYDCRNLATGCSSCIGARMGSRFMCGWCSTTCEVTQECSNMFIIDGDSCPPPVITSFFPTSGPVEGGTAVTVMGTNLGVSLSDLQRQDTLISLGGVNCTPLNTSFVPGIQFVCETTDFGSTGDKNFVVRIGLRDSTSTAGAFMAVNPTITDVSPVFGPVAGGTELTVRGTDLDVGNQDDTMVTLLLTGSNATCSVIDIQAEEIRCMTTAGELGSVAMVMVSIDAARVNNPSVTFSYLNNPNVTSVDPTNTIPSGGITLTFSGQFLDVVQRPMLEVSLSVGGPLTSNCTSVSNTTITCVTPEVTGAVAFDYSLILDGAPPTTSSQLEISVRPDPTNFRLASSAEVQTGTQTIIQITGDNLENVLASEIIVTVGGQECLKTSTTTTIERQIFCTAPLEPPGGVTEAEIRVMIGENIDVALAEVLTYTTQSETTVPLEIIIPAVAGGLLLIIVLFLLITCCIVCGYKSKHRKTEQRWNNLLAQMELLEIEMADECKRAFTELQTDLADLVHITDQNLPYRDFRTFAMRFLFPQDGDEHPVLHPLALPEKADHEQVKVQLNSFRHLVMDKKFLLIFVRTLEAQGQRFSLNDRCIVASLLMVTFQDNLDYATEILQTLLAELMRKSMSKNSHPKLLLRRTESVAEKMLANWLAFLLFPYLLEHVGEKLFILFRAIKSQLEKGAVDVITGEAKNSLSEEKLLRHHRDIKVVDGVVVADSGEEYPVRLLDCDSITQAKEKVLDVLYKNTPVSKRPQLTEIDLELINTGAAGIPLRDQDATNVTDGEWTKVNTLGHYKLDEMSQAHADNPRNPVPKFRIRPRPDRPVSGMSFDMLGTIIANLNAGTRASTYMPSDLTHTYHLVKPEPEEPGEGQRGQKIVSEVFLTRLLSTKRILQPYVDDLFESIFAVPHGRPLPKAIKSLFDFLDQQAAELGIQDPEILHTWKTNSVPLRFWVNVIKNPDFLFDINKSVTVDSCLTVIAQAYIDACSTTEFKYTKDTPAARLLYVNDVKKYKSEVLQYYGTVQSLPKVSQTDMCEYLRETAQVCADSVHQYASDICSEKSGPTSMKGQLYFVTESALYELFKFASKFSDEVTEGLNEEGLTIQAASFDQIRRNMRSATHN